MFCKALCVFLVLCCGYVNSVEYNRGVFIKNISSDVQIKQNKFPKSKLHKIAPVIKNDERRTKKISKRGIVMVDSDFDIPSETFIYENHLNTDDDMFRKNEGSGTASEELNNEELNTTTEETTKMTSELQKVTNISTVSTQSTTKETISTREKMDMTTNDTEGSGDSISLITDGYSTKETSTKSYTTPEYDIYEKVPDMCMNSTCDANDLFIITSEERIKIPEGINFTLTCTNNNHSLHNMLQWYKSNESEYFLQTLGTNAQLHFNIPNTKLIHSGTYVCVKWINKHSCCNTRSVLVIYEVPLYRYHLLIIGLIILASLALCIFCSVRQSIALKKYTKVLAEKHGKMKSLL